MLHLQIAKNQLNTQLFKHTFEHNINNQNMLRSDYFKQKHRPNFAYIIVMIFSMANICFF